MSTSPKLLRSAVLAAFYLGWTLLLTTLWLFALPASRTPTSTPRS